VSEGISGGHEKKYYQLKNQRYLGEDAFIERIETEGKKSEDWTYEIPLKVIGREVSRAMTAEEDELYSDRRDRKVAGVRGLVSYLARRISGYTVKEIADHFRRSSVTISEAIEKVEDLLRKDKAFERKLNLLSQNLIKGRKRKYRITEA
jgi:chromosomal replication initiation ATPase DnaA